MFMFWSKRTLLTKRLLKAKVRHETECEAQGSSSSSSSHVQVRSPMPSLLVEDERATTTKRRDPMKQQRPVRRQPGCCCCCCGCAQDEEDDAGSERLAWCKQLLKSLKEVELEALFAAVDSHGADLGNCVLVPRLRSLEDAAELEILDELEASQDSKQQHHLRQLRRHHRHCRRYLHRWQHRYYLRQQRRPPPDRGDAALLPEPHLLSCQFWRWPDLDGSSDLKRLPTCHVAKDPGYVCCNPYHWSRLCKPESPPPPYCLIPDRLRPEDRAPSEGDLRRCRNIAPVPFPSSLTTNGEGDSEQKEWCTLAYWELGGRVGRLYPVESSSVNVFDSLHDGNGLCLATLAENYTAPLSVLRTRNKIGLGLTLSQEDDGVWAYNRSENPIFVNSPTLDDPESRTLLVYRVPPGFCLNVFDRSKVRSRNPLVNNNNDDDDDEDDNGGGFRHVSGPVDVNSVRISFAKGWGPKYSRQEITSCPCWLEILLAPCR